MADVYDIRGFIFDLDGVLTDTSELHYRAWQRFCDEEGIPFDRARCEHLRGIHRSAAMRWLLGDRPTSAEQFAELSERKNRYYLELADTISPSNVLPGARALLEEVAAAGLKIAVGSASKNARAVIGRLQLDALIEAVSDGNVVAASKPAPDLFLHAAGQLHLPPPDCIVVEDAEAGVQAAHAGGMRAVGLGPPQRVGRAELVLPDLSGARLAQIVETLQTVAPPVAAGT